MRFKDIYDDMPDGTDQRRHNQTRLAELEIESEARRARIAMLIAEAQLSRLNIQPPVRHSL
jgi:hypothetical protein